MVTDSQAGRWMSPNKLAPCSVTEFKERIQFKTRGPFVLLSCHIEILQTPKHIYRQPVSIMIITWVLTAPVHPPAHSESQLSHVVLFTWYSPGITLHDEMHVSPYWNWRHDKHWSLPGPQHPREEHSGWQSFPSRAAINWNVQTYQQMQFEGK